MRYFLAFLFLSLPTSAAAYTCADFSGINETFCVENSESLDCVWEPSSECFPSVSVEDCETDPAYAGCFVTAFDCSVGNDSDVSCETVSEFGCVWVPPDYCDGETEETCLATAECYWDGGCSGPGQNGYCSSGAAVDVCVGNYGDVCSDAPPVDNGSAVASSTPAFVATSLFPQLLAMTLFSVLVLGIATRSLRDMFY